MIDWETRQDRLNAPVGARTDRHIITDASVTGPVMVDTARFDRHQAGEAMRSRNPGRSVLRFAGSRWLADLLELHRHLGDLTARTFAIGVSRHGSRQSRRIDG